MFLNNFSPVCRPWQVPPGADRTPAPLSLRHWLASLAMTGAKTSEHDFSSEHGDDLGGMADSRRRISSVVTGRNDDRVGPR